MWTSPGCHQVPPWPSSCSDGPGWWSRSLSEMEGLQLWEGFGHPSWRNDRCGWPSYLRPLWVCIFLIKRRSVCTVLDCAEFCGTREDSRWSQQEHSREEAARARWRLQSGRHRIDHEMQKREKRERTAIWQNVWLTRNQSQATVFLPITLRKIAYNRKLPEWSEKTLFMCWQQHKFDFDKHEIQKPTDLVGYSTSCHLASGKYQRCPPGVRCNHIHAVLLTNGKILERV